MTALVPMSDATVSAMQYCPLRKLLHMQSCPGLCKNRTCKCCARKRACMHWTYRHAAWIFAYLTIAANTQRPKISHVIHDMHLQLLYTVDQGRLIYCKVGLARGGHNCICKCVRADTIALCSSVRADKIAYAKPSGGHYCTCNNVLRIILHRGHNCMQHRLGTFF